MKKRGYYFTLDALIALGILSIGIYLIYSSYSSTPATSQTQFSSQDLLAIFSKTTIADLNSQYLGIEGTLWQQGYVPDKDFTLLEEFAYLYSIGNISLARSAISNATNMLIPNQYRFEVWMDGALIYPSLSDEQSKNQTDVLIPAKKIVYGFLDRESGTLFGPYVAEVIVWRQA